MSYEIKVSHVTNNTFDCAWVSHGHPPYKTASIINIIVERHGIHILGKYNEKQIRVQIFPPMRSFLEF